MYFGWLDEDNCSSACEIHFAQKCSANFANIIYKLTKCDQSDNTTSELSLASTSIFTRPIHTVFSISSVVAPSDQPRYDSDQMRVFLVRHGETEHNIAGLLAGSTDSRLTNHGLIQAQRLGEHLVKKRALKFNHIFASDLQRAHRTANEICHAQNAAHAKDATINTIALPILREQDFGSFELISWSRAQNSQRKELAQDDPNFKPKETKIAMKARADVFLGDHLLPLLALDDESEQNVAVVSHGLFLAALWRALLSRFRSNTISFSVDIEQKIPGRPLEYLSSWSNTGFLELQILNNSTEVSNATTPESATNEAALESLHLDATMKICAVNATNHLASLKRTRGGVGSSASDEKQARVDSFFSKKRKFEDTEPTPAKRVR